MAKYDQQIGDLKNHLNNAQSVLIALPSQTTVDKLASALSLMLSLKSSGKQVSVLTQDTIKVSHSNLFGVGNVSSQLPQNSSGDFVITLEGVVQNGGVPALEKLDWEPSGNNLELKFHTKPGQKFEPINISHRYQGGGNVNLIFTLGATNLQDLGEVYPLNISQFTGVPIINIDNSANNQNFGFVNIVDQNAGTISEMIMEILKGLNLNIDQDIASNLVSGIYDATQNLTQNVKPETFIALGEAMQRGGHVPVSGNQVTQQPVTQPIPQPQVSFQAPAPNMQNNGFDLRQIFQIPPAPGSSAQDFPTPQVAPQPAEEKPSGEQVQAVSGESEVQNPAPDWLTPKIYKGGSLG